MKKIALAVPAALGVGSAFAQNSASLPVVTDAADAISQIGTTATTAFNTFAGTIVPLLLGGLVVVGGLQLGKWVIRKIRP